MGKNGFSPQFFFYNRNVHSNLKHPSFRNVLTTHHQVWMKTILLSLFLLNIIYPHSIGYSQEIEITLLHSNSSNGVLENCACPEHPLGALEKRLALIKEIRKSNEHVLLLDSGDLLSSVGNSIKDSLAIESINLMDYDAITIGDQEFSSGVDFFRKVVNNGKIPFVSSNVAVQGQSLSLPYRIFDVGGIRTAVIGVTSPSVFLLFPDDKKIGVEVTNPDSVLEDIISEVEGKSDLIILLSHSGYDEDLVLATKYPSIDIIVGGHSQSMLEEPTEVDETLIVQAGHSGFYLGELDLILESSGKILSYEWRLIPLTLELPDDPGILSLIEEYDRIVAAGMRKATVYVPILGSKFAVLASEDCQDCHFSEYNAWKRDDHSVAFKTIVDERKTKDSECLSCHTSGFGRDDGFTSLTSTAHLINVNCTECHLTSREHLDDPSETSVERIVEATCTRCHNATNSPEFVYANYFLKTNHTVKISYDDRNYHIVKKGESLSKIALIRWGEISIWKDIYRLNRNEMNDPDIIYPGQRLIIPEIKK